MDRREYPPDWPAISRRIRERAGGKCEWCPARQGEPHPVTGSRVVLTVAHLKPPKSDCRPENLVALCQRCHLNYDRADHIRNRRENRRRRQAAGDLFSGPYALALDRGRPIG